MPVLEKKKRFKLMTSASTSEKQNKRKITCKVGRQKEITKIREVNEIQNKTKRKKSKKPKARSLRRLKKLINLQPE